MDKQGETKNLIWIVILAIAVFGIYLVFSGSGEKSLLEHKTPADLSKGESGTGLDLKFFDKDGKEIQIPDWFKVNSVVDVGSGFTIVRRTTAPTCTAVTQCAGYLTNPNIMCWNGKCVLGKVASMTAGVSVTNPTSSQLAFLNVAPTLAKPLAFDTALSKTAYAKLSPGQTTSWTSASMTVSQWEATTQTFNVTVQGTNEYNGALIKVSDAIALAFDADPTGSFTVAVQSPI